MPALPMCRMPCCTWQAMPCKPKTSISSTSAETLLENTRQRLDDQLKERAEALDTFFEGLGLEEGEEARTPRQLLDELQGMVHVPLRLSPEEQRLLRDEPRQVRDAIRQQVEAGVTAQALIAPAGRAGTPPGRIAGAERRSAPGR